MQYAPGDRTEVEVVRCRDACGWFQTVVAIFEGLLKKLASSLRIR
jgi:hypothetical protein